jgi:predicted metal-dependent hydrolase
MTSPDRPLPPPPKPERPRDELGRPLPPGSENRLHLPDFDALTLEENHALAIQLFNDRNYFGAHEAWETCWAQAKGTDEEEFFKGFAQLGAGYTHWLRGNPHGVQALLGRALARIRARGSPHRGIDADAFARILDADIAAMNGLDRGEQPPLGERRVPEAS